MKKILILLGILVLVSCDENADPEIYKGESLASFTNGSSATYFVEEQDSQFGVQVGVTVAADVDREFSVNVVEEETTAVSSSYTIADSFTLPAGEYVADVTVNGNFEEVIDGQTIVLELSEIAEGAVANFDNKFELSLVQFCPYSQQALVGDWTFSSEFWGTETTVTLEAGEDEFTYIAKDLYGGLGIPNTQDVVLEVEQINSTTFELNIQQQGAFDANTPIFAANYGLLSVAGDGILDTCGVMDMTLEFTVGAGSFGDSNEVLTKN